MRKPLSPFAVMLFMAVALASTTGCATVFRRSYSKVHFESEPNGAQAKIGSSSDAKTTPTPGDVEVERSGTTGVHITKQGFQDHRGVVKKKLNGGWVAADVISCFWALCIPLLVDAISGAWMDVTPTYNAKLDPAAGAGSAAPAVGSATPAPTTSTPDTASSLSESERKATARAAYIEGVGLQEKNDCAGALPKFEVAQKMFNAPTHLLHIGQCQAALGKLVEAQETYETLTRTSLPPDAPQPFKQAQEEGKKELPALKPRIPTLRVQISPAPNTLKSLLVLVNGSPMPNELVGIARPVNPGKYKVSAEASGMKAPPQEIEVVEGAQKSIDLVLKK